MKTPHPAPYHLQPIWPAAHYSLNILHITKRGLPCAIDINTECFKFNNIVFIPEGTRMMMSVTDSGSAHMHGVPLPVFYVYFTVMHRKDEQYVRCLVDMVLGEESQTALDNYAFLFGT
jgi:hypothetical protein